MTDAAFAAKLPAMRAMLISSALVATIALSTAAAAAPTSEECAIFGFDAPVPCLLIKRRSYGADGDMLEYVEGLFRGDTYTYKLTLTT